MTSSRSRALKSNFLAVIAAAFGIVVLSAGVAQAEKKKRVVVLEFEGKSAEKFHESVEKLVEKKSDVELVPTDKWNSTAASIAADGKLSERIRKVAKKLHVDAVITGKIEKKSGTYTVKLKLRDGKTGEVVGAPAEIKSEEPKFDKASRKELRDGLIASIDTVGGGAPEVAEATPKEPKEPKEPKTDGDTGINKKHHNTGEDAVASNDKPPVEDDSGKKNKKNKKNKSDGEVVADTSGSSETSVKASETNLDSDAYLAADKRAVDVSLGLSFVARRLNFDTSLSPGLSPPGYKQTIPVPGALIDATVYPLAFSHGKADVTKNIGLNILVDQVIHINSQLTNAADGTKTKLQTTESYYALGATFRIPLGQALVFTALARYARQAFTIAHPSGVDVDMPSVAYSMLQPEGKIQYALSPSLSIDARVGIIYVLNAGNIQDQAQYGKGNAFGGELELGADYMLKKNIFARASIRGELIKLGFNGTGDMTTMRDSDPATNDVKGATDTYFGATLSIGYLY